MESILLHLKIFQNKTRIPIFLPFKKLRMGTTEKKDDYPQIP